MRTDYRDEPERLSDTRKPPKPQTPSTDTLEFVRRQGLAAEAAGQPPLPPHEFAMLATEWLEGWQSGKNARMKVWHDLFSGGRDEPLR